MSIIQLDTENSDLDLTSQVTILTDTPDASKNTLCQAYAEFGDGTKNLDGTGGFFQFTLTVGGITVQPNPTIIQFDTSARSAVWTNQFSVPANTEVIWKVLSPNSADSDVDVTTYLYNVAPNEDSIIESTLSLEHILRILLSRNALKARGGGDSPIRFRDVADSKDRLVLNVDSNGNRSSVTLDGT